MARPKRKAGRSLQPCSLEGQESEPLGVEARINLACCNPTCSSTCNSSPMCRSHHDTVQQQGREDLGQGRKAHFEQEEVPAREPGRSVSMGTRKPTNRKLFPDDDGATLPAADRKRKAKVEVEVSFLPRSELIDIESAMRECQSGNSPRAVRQRVGKVKALLLHTKPPGSISPLSPVGSCGAVTWRPPAEGIVLCELFGGIATGLEAALRAGLRIKRYVYCDKDEKARQVAEDRCSQLHQRFPKHLPHQALWRAFDTFPQDVQDIKQEHLRSLGQLDLVVAGWECQGFSSAGLKKGLDDPRSALFLNLVQILKWGQEMHPGLAFVPEDDPAQFDRDKKLREDYEKVTYFVGEPFVIDAAQCNSFAHRVRNYFTNLAPVPELNLNLLHTEREPHLRVKDILGEGREAVPVTKGYAIGTLPFYKCNNVGQERSAWPTLVAHLMAKQFLKRRDGNFLAGLWT